MVVSPFLVFCRVFRWDFILNSNKMEVSMMGLFSSIALFASLGDSDFFAGLMAVVLGLWLFLFLSTAGR